MNDVSPEKDAAENRNRPPIQNRSLLKIGLVVELSMVVLALILARFGFYDHAQPLNEWNTATWLSGLLIGLAATVPMLGYLLLFHSWRPKFARPFNQFVDEMLVPMFRGKPFWELGLLSLLAGFCEEMLFRWSLQGGITHVLQGPLAPLFGLLIASLVFGICHWVNWLYGVTTILIGIYLGAIMIWSGSFLGPAIAHTLYDFIAMIYIANRVCRPAQQEAD